MKVPKLIIIIALNIFVIVLISIPYSIIKGGHPSKMAYITLLSIIPAVWTIIGYFFYLLDKPRKNIVYYIRKGLALSLGILILLGAAYFFPNAWHMQRYGNIDYNRNGGTIIETGYIGSNTAYRERALDSLETLFADKNSFRIVSTFIKTFDTVLENRNQSITMILFSYYMDDHRSRILTAKYLINSNEFIRSYVGLPNFANKEYFSVYGKDYESLSSSEKEEAIIYNTLDDSLKKKFPDFKKSLREAK